MPSFFERLRQKLNRGNSWLTMDLATLFRGRKIDAEILEELETRLLTADVGVEATQYILEALRKIPPRDSDEWYIALLGRQFPGSWLPFGQEQVIRCAEPRLRLVSSVSGRLDYIETINRWNARIGARSFRKTLLKLQLLPRWLTSADFRLAFTSGVSANQVAFERELLDHYRLVFENRE